MLYLKLRSCKCHILHHGCALKRKNGQLKHFFCRNWCILDTLNAYFSISVPRHPWLYCSMLTRMVTYIVRKKQISCAGLRSMWKTNKYHVQTTNFKQTWIIRYYKERKYTIDCGYCIERLREIYRKTSHSDPIYVTLLLHLIRFLMWHQFVKYATIFLHQYLVMTSILPLLAMHGVLQVFVKFMKWKYKTSLWSCFNARPTGADPMQRL